MVIDTSAVIAILTNEPGSERLVQALDEAPSLQMSVASMLEVAIVIESRYGDKGRRILDRWLQESSIEIAVVTRDQVEAARDGYRRFGKGRHPASLNFGDCFAYGLAKVHGGPLLFCGNDFNRTDIRCSLP